MKILKIFLLIMLMTIYVSADVIDDITYYTEEYPPYNYTENNKLKGISIDIFKEILNEMGKPNIFSKVSAVPWSRSYELIQTNDNIVLFSMTRTEAREKLFKWVGPLTSTDIGLLAKKSRKIKITSPNDIKKYKVGAVKSDIGEQLLLENNVPRDNIQSVGNSIQNVKKINADRIDLFAYEVNVGKSIFKQENINPNDYENVFTLKSAELYIAFSKSTSDSIIKRFQDALDAVKASGKYDEILSRY